MSSVSSLTQARKRSQAWFPGVYVPIRHVQGVEIFDQPRGGVRLDRTTLQGTAAEMRVLAAQLVRAAHDLEQNSPAKRPPQRVVQRAAA